MRRLFSAVLSLVMTLLSATQVLADKKSDMQVAELLSQSEAPEGVVFEVVSGKQDYLTYVLPIIRGYSEQLREKFSQLDIAIVTHGKEQFSLTYKQLQKRPEVSRLLDEVIGQNVQVHVCGTYAEYNGVEDSEFSEKINVAAEGPAQIKDYVQLGYTHIRVRL